MKKHWESAYTQFEVVAKSSVDPVWNVGNGESHASQPHHSAGCKKPAVALLSQGGCLREVFASRSVCLYRRWHPSHTANSSSAGSMCWCTWNTCARAHNRILAHTTHVPHVPQTQCRRNCFRLTSQRRGASQSSSHTRFDCLPTCHRITATTHNHRLTVPAPAAPRALACWARFALQGHDRLLTQVHSRKYYLICTSPLWPTTSVVCCATRCKSCMADLHSPLMPSLVRFSLSRARSPSC
jgi:hypothetical protein